MYSAPAAGGWRKRRRERKKKWDPGQTGEHAKQRRPQSGKKNQKSQLQIETKLQRLLQRGCQPEKAVRIAYDLDYKCACCFFEFPNKTRAEHDNSEVHKEAVAFRNQCFYEGRQAPTLQECIDKIDKEIAELKMAKEGKPDKESSDMRAPKENSDIKTSDMEPNMESYVVEAPIMGPLDNGEPKMEASDMGAPTKESSSNKVPSKKPFDRVKFFRDVAFIGLECILQYPPDERGVRHYTCNLCPGVFNRKTIFYHVQSIRHRIVYLAMHHKDMGVTLKFRVNSRHKYKQLVDCAQQVEKKFGRKIIPTTDEVYVELDPKDPQERKNQAVSPGPRNPASRGDPRFDRDSEFARLAFAKAIMMERDLLRARGLSHHDIDERLMEIEGFRRSGVKTMDEQVFLQRAFTDERSLMSQEDLMRPRLASDGRYPMMEEDLSMHPRASDGQRTQDDVMEEAGLPHGLRDGRAVMSREGAALHQPVVVTPLTKGDQGNTFRELKASHGNEKRGLAKRWESTEDGIENLPEQCEVEDFWCNDELYDFLAKFVVKSKQDVEYLLKITDGFANALVRHRNRAEDMKMKIQEEKKKLEEEKIAFVRDPGVRAIKKAMRQIQKEIEKRAKSPPAGAPVSKQARTDLSSSASALTPASGPQVKPQMALSFDSYQPAAPSGIHRQPNQQKGPQGQPSQPQQRQKYGSTRPQEADNSYSQNVTYPISQLGNGSTGGRYDGHTDSYSYGYYGYQGYNYNTSNPSSEKRSSNKAATSRPPGDLEITET